jgi:hypothetical protein
VVVLILFVTEVRSPRPFICDGIQWVFIYIFRFSAHAFQVWPLFASLTSNILELPAFSDQYWYGDLNQDELEDEGIDYST